MRSFTSIIGKGIWLSLALLLTICNQAEVRAEGTPSLAPDPADAAALYIGAGNTQGLGGDYGQFAWIGSPSRLYFNLQNLNEKAYIGFSLPWNNRQFQPINPYTQGSGIVTNLEFRIMRPDDTHLTCFGNSSGWQPLNTGNITTRTEVVSGPAPIAGSSGYAPFIFDPAACSGATLTGDYYIEFRSTDPTYDPDQPGSGFFIEYFDITVADASDQKVDGRVWSNNWGIGIQQDGDVNDVFDRAFNGAFYVCSGEGFVSKINFKNTFNNRQGKDSDQRSGFRAGNFNVSFNTTGPNNSGNIVADRQSQMNVNAPNPELRVFLNAPSEDLCKPVDIGEFAPASNLLTGCANNRCINMTATQPGQVEILIEKQGGNGLLDVPSDRLLGYVVTAADLVSDPQTADYVYEFCIPWDGKDGEGNFLPAGDFKIAGFYSQGVYHFPVYDAEFNDDGFSVETINPPRGPQKLYYDDTNISEANNITGEPKNGSNGCFGPCHSWTGEWSDFYNSVDNTDQIYGNFNTINTWWFAVTKTSDISGNINNEVAMTLECPADVTLCAGNSIEPSVIGAATSPNDDCTVQIEYNDIIISQQGCNQVIERTWTGKIDGIPNAETCTQTIRIEDKQGPTIASMPTTMAVSCDAVPTPPTTFAISDDCDQTLTDGDVIFTETRTDGACANSYILNRSWKITDACGSSTTYQQTITVQDTDGPIISGVPADATIACSNIPAVPTTITATDACGGAITVDFNEGTVAGTCNILRTWSAMDDCGNITIETQTIKIDDTAKPNWVNFENTVITNCDDQLPDTTPEAVDECGNGVTVTMLEEVREEIDGCPDAYNLIRTWRAEDACGNKRTKKQTVKIRDNTKPEWVDFPKVECIECTATPPSEAPQAIDNCDNAVEVVLLRDSIAAGDCVSDYELFKFWQATDNCGNKITKRQRITVKDTRKPEWDNFPNFIVADCDNIPVDTKPSATDNCSQVTITMLAERVDGSCSEDKHRIVRLWEAKDECGNTRTKEQVIRLKDNTKPQWVDFPAAITVACDAIPAESAPAATDNCDTDVSVTLLGTTKQDQTCDNTYTMMREWQAIDDCGNTRTRKQYIYVRDEIKPVWVDFPAAQTMACGDSPAMVAPQATDNCGEAVVVEMMEQTEEPGTCAGKYTMYRKWKATDACGNSITKKQRFNFRDTTDPVWAYFPENNTVFCGQATGGGGTGGTGPIGAAAAASDVPTASDNCDNNVSVVLLETTRVDGNCSGNYKLRHKWQATDACGNSITKTHVVTYKDNVDPTWVNFPETITVNCDAIPAQSAPAATDLCSNVTVELLEETIEAGTCPIAQRIVRRWRATDDCGNSIAKNEIIRVRDRTAPTLLTVATPLTILCDAADQQATFNNWLATNGGATATDNCGDLEWFQEFPKFDFDCGNSITVKFVAIDQCGNQVESSAVVTIGDDETPSWTTAPNSLNQTLACSAGNPTIVAPVAADNCSTPTVSVVSDQTIAGACAGTSVRTITWKAVDACGNESAPYIASITSTDNVAPSLVGVPANTAANCDAVPAAATVTATDNCDASIAVTFAETRTDDASCVMSYTLTRVWTATDACGNTTSETQQIAVSDNTPPTIVGVPANITTSCNNIPARATLTVTDNCDGTAALTFEERNTASSTCANAYTLTRVWRAVDVCGNVAEVTQLIEVTDDVAPVLAGIPANAVASCGAIPAAPAVTATDDCDTDITVTLSEAYSGSACSGETLTRTWTATDDCGNTTSASQIINLYDNVAPVLSGVPSSLSLICGDAIPDAPQVTVSDNCSADMTIDFQEQTILGACGGSYSIERTWTAVDVCGNAVVGKQTITLTDNVKPTWGEFNWTSTIQCGTAPSAVAPTATDNCGTVSPVLLEEMTEPGECATPTIVRRWRVEDACGNRRTRKQYIKFKDNTKPEWVNFPEAVRVSCDAIPAAVAPQATDACSDVTVELMGEEQKNVVCANKYTLVRVWKVTDACGNSRTKNQRFNVFDATKPDWVDFPDKITVECADLTAAISPTYTDGCSEVTLTFLGETKEDVECAGKYTLFREWQIEDACGNKRTRKQRINVKNTSKPEWVNFPETITVNCDAIPAQTAPNATATACGVGVQVNLVEETYEDGVCPIVQKIIRKWEAIDGCGNRITKKEVIRIRDKTVPTLLTVANNLQLDCSDTNVEANLQAWIDNHGGATAADNCDNLTWFHECPKMDYNCGNTYTVTFTAVDGCGNRVTTNGTVSFGDNTAPALVGVPVDVKISCGSSIPAAPTVTATDNCDPSVVVSFEETREDGNCANTYSLVRVWTAVDACGNEIEEEQVINIIDDTAPVLSNVPTNITQECGGGTGPVGAAASVSVVTATDNCDGAVNVVETSEVTGGSCAGSILTKTWTATDACGNTSSLSQTITLEDTTPPSIVCPSNVEVQALGGCGAGGRISIDLPVAQDNCDGNVLVTSSTDLNGDFPAGTTTVQLTATDDCGNTANCSFNVVVSGGTAGLTSQPCPENITISCDALAGQSIASWEPPSGDACCSSCTGATTIAGYTFLGERGGHRYYLSSTTVNWNQAKSTAATMGGYLAVINDPAENAFLAGLIQNQKVYIGLTDVGSEGNFTWSNGEAATYRNWSQAQPNNKNNKQHVVQLLPNGTWNDTYTTDKLQFLIEMTCIDVRQTGGPMNGSSFPVGESTVTYSMTDNCGKTETCSFNVTVEPAIQLHVDEDVTFDCKPGTDGYTLGWAQPSVSSCCDDCPPVGENINGFIYMGRINGHQYYCSLGKATYPQATAIANSLNGYLAVVNTQAESDMLTTFLNGTSAYIGLSDKAQEGRYRWQNGDPLSFQNWAAGQPNNKGGVQDYVQILPNGKWDDIYDNLALEFIVELPCREVEQIGGLAPGSFFGPGVHTITYRATDNCGNTAEESFDITINACAAERPTTVCPSRGKNVNYFWIKQVKCGSIDNVTGKDGGYGDYTNQSTSFARGASQQISLTPGYASSRYPLFWRVMIDYNQDGDFNDRGEVVLEYSHTNPIRGTFRVSPNAKTGATTMRVSMAYGRYFGGCQTFTYGEVEDYTVNIPAGAGIANTSQSRSEFEVEVLEPEFQLPLGTSLEGELSTPTATVYPNPVNSLLTIDFDQITSKNSQLRIFNSVGQQIHLQQLSGDAQQQVQLDVRDYENGIYLISIEGSEQQPLLRKFTKF